MKTVSTAFLILAAGLAPLPAYAFSEPLSESSIDTADFAVWTQQQQEADSVAASARNDPTIPDTEAAEGPDEAAVPSTDPETVASAADGIDSPAPPEIAVTDEPGQVVETPAYSTDGPDEAALETADEPKTPDPFLIRLQVLLDRAYASPGVIDGYLGDNTRKAIEAYERMRDLPADGEPDADLWNILAVDQGKAMTTYEITEADLEERFVEEIPSDYGEMAEMEWLGYRDPVEMLAERFHVHADLLKKLNPNADFNASGTAILVPNIGKGPEAKVAKIVVDKTRGELFAYDAAGAIVLAYPVTIGSADTPSPDGVLTVQAIAPNPTYHYSPETNFQQGENKEVLTIPAGPNGPVGSMWIDLSQPTFGLHGTAHPELVDKSNSHGCVRLTNWDAETLAKLVEPGVTVVEFEG
ncbi:L,D-transpeptidase family protein [Aurantimonas aggregata]|uniref:L,D-transpeptidase family protein n=1 Tax=Aurantimonas aggregata TaxID=2047720 RepID=UPI001FE3BE70|nr:L,D-transpeptidase family protein [Aurantimonas aggregata]